MFIFKRALPRRTVLRGLGATIGLPLLDAMVPALTAASKTAAKPTKRLTFIYQGAGVIPKWYTPPTAGKNFELSPILEAHASVKDYLTVVSGTAQTQANAMGEGNDDHPRASAVWLTGVHASARGKTAGEIRLGTSVDQIVAQHVGKGTRLSSLEMSLDGDSILSCADANCFFSSTLSWRNPTSPNPMENRPRVVFERLVGEGSTPEERRELRLKRKSILDSVAAEAGRFQQALGPGDRRKLEEYFESIRDIERRIENAENSSAGSVELPDVPSIVPDSLEEQWALMVDLLVLAYRMDATRVSTVKLTADQSGRSYPNLGIPEGGHTCSHHRRQPALMDKRRRILAYHESLQVQFLEKLRATADGDGNLLDHSLVISGQGMGDGDLHDHVNLPLWIAGKAGGGLSGNTHIALAPEKNTPQCNVWLSVMHLMDVPAPASFGDSTEPLALS